MWKWLVSAMGKVEEAIDLARGGKLNPAHLRQWRRNRREEEWCVLRCVFCVVGLSRRWLVSLLILMSLLIQNAEDVDVVALRGSSEANTIA